MLPQYEDDLKSDFIIGNYPDLTYRMDLESIRVAGKIDGLDAVKQAIFKILNTNRYQHAIYSWKYGAELEELIGQTVPLVYSEIKNRIIDALMQDSRIRSVDDFSFEKRRGIVSVRFRVSTIYGEVETGKEVAISNV